jgi:tRNA dimethylallyltransferase
VSPKRQYTVADFKRDAGRALADIFARGKTPIICGGTGQYIDALLFNTSIPEVPPNPKLRKVLEQKTVEELFAELEQKDPARAKTIDRRNKRRLIRALEVINVTGKPIPQISRTESPYAIRWIYLHPARPVLQRKIAQRLDARLSAGMIEEAAEAHARGLPWKRMDDLGLEYRYLARLLQGKINAEQMRSELLKEIIAYAKRQETWFKKYAY